MTIIVSAGIGIAFAQDPIPPIRLVDAHTAGLVPKGSYQVESRVFPSGDPENSCGLLVGIVAGITDRFNLGLAYGGEGIVGRRRDAQFNPFPGCLVKYRLFNESFFLPAVAIGFDYQGYGGIADQERFGYKGYIYKSQGFFAAFSKSYLFFRIIQLGFHGDVCYSMEELDRVSWPNAVAGLDMGLGEILSLVAEYDFGLNAKDQRRADESANYAKPQEGYFHAGIRWSINSSLAVEFDARDITSNRRGGYRRVGWGREIKAVYTSQIR